MTGQSAGHPARLRVPDPDRAIIGARGQGTPVRGVQLRQRMRAECPARAATSRPSASVMRMVWSAGPARQRGRPSGETASAVQADPVAIFRGARREVDEVVEAFLLEIVLRHTRAAPQERPGGHPGRQFRGGVPLGVPAMTRRAREAARRKPTSAGARAGGAGRSRRRASSISRSARSSMARPSWCRRTYSSRRSGESASWYRRNPSSSPIAP